MQCANKQWVDSFRALVIFSFQTGDEENENTMHLYTKTVQMHEQPSTRTHALTRAKTWLQG